MKLNEIHAFITVARTGSIQTAAWELHLTQSAVSRLIQRLEHDLNATLFDRQTKPLALTQDGRIALEHGKRVLNATEAFSEALSSSAAPSGLLRIGTAHALAELVAERPMDLLRSIFPNVTLQISVDWAAPLIERLHRGELDAAVLSLLTDSEPKTDLPKRLIDKEAVKIIGAANLAETCKASLHAMNEIGWVIQPEGCGYRTALTRALNRVGAGPPKIVLEAFGKDLQLSIVARGAGFGLLPESHLQSIPDEKRIEAFNVPDFQLAVSTWFIRRHQTGRLSGPLNEIERSLILAK